LESLVALRCSSTAGGEPSLSLIARDDYGLRTWDVGLGFPGGRWAKIPRSLAWYISLCFCEGFAEMLLEIEKEE
jgi:hypothetical protein